MSETAFGRAFRAEVDAAWREMGYTPEQVNQYMRDWDDTRQFVADPTKPMADRLAAAARLNFYLAPEDQGTPQELVERYAMT